MIIEYDEDGMLYEFDDECKCNVTNCICYNNTYECCAIANYDCVAKMDLCEE